MVFFGSHGARDFHVVAEPFVFLHGNERPLLCLDPCVFAGDNPEAVDDIHVGPRLATRSATYMFSPAMTLITKTSVATPG